MSKRRPRIAVTGPATGSRILWWFTHLAVKIAGGKAYRISANSKVDFSLFDGYVLMGGSDINPELYQEAALIIDSRFDRPRDELEQKVIRYAVKEKKPLLGICRGMQILNVTLGGSLYQEAKDVLEDFLPSSSLISKIIGRRKVEVNPKSQLFGILGNYEEYLVNSIHHQAVNRVGEGLRVVAREKNNLVQAIEPAPDNPHSFLIGVQWHPELMLHAASARRLFKTLVNAAHTRRAELAPHN